MNNESSRKPKELQRYDLLYILKDKENTMEPIFDGEFVLYIDYVAALTEAQARIEKLEATLTRIKFIVESGSGTEEEALDIIHKRATEALGDENE